METMRIFIACADERLRLALLLLLDHQPGMVVVGLSDRMPGLLTQLEGSQPHVLLLDWGLSDEMEVNFFADLHNLKLPPKTIVLASDPTTREAILTNCADYFISKDAPPDNLITTLSDIRVSKIPKNGIEGARSEQNSF